MPGERLMCVWDAAFARNPRTSHKQLTRDTLHDVVVQFKNLPSIKYSKSKFETTFKSNNDVTLTRFQRYLFDGLADKEAPQCLVQEEVGNKCWELSKKIYISKSLSESNAKKLWEIFNLLADVASFPPQINPGLADWFSDKVCKHLGKDGMTTSSPRQVKSYTYDTLLDRLVQYVFVEQTEEAATSCIDVLHSWLVLEILKSGWLFTRSRKQANWTTWVKRWFVLSSTRLSYYDNQKVGNKVRGEVFLSGSELETLPPFKGSAQKLNGRFKLSNRPYIELEMATQEENDCRPWIKSIQELIDAAKRKTTPMQRILRDNWEQIKKGNFSELDKSEERNAAAMAIAHPETVASGLENSSTNGHAEDSHGTSHAGNHSKVVDSSDETDLIRESNEKIKTIFMQIDTNGNGKIDEEEFKQFIKGMGLKINDKEIHFLFKSVDKDDSRFLTFQEFSEYFANVLLDEFGDGKAEAKLRGAFLAADRDGTGKLNFKEYAEYLWDKKRQIQLDKLVEAFEQMDLQKDGQISYDEFRAFYKTQISDLPEVDEDEYSEEKQSLSAVEKKLKNFYQSTDAGELANFIKQRWNKFDSFRRYGASGELIMAGGEGMVNDIVPGDYSLGDLSWFSDLPPVIPSHTVVKGVRWQKSQSPGRSGKAIFPSDYDGVLQTDIATPEHLRYYGCSFAEGNQLKVSLLHRHGIQDFTYENEYLNDYVALSNGGSGIEKHEFAHLDCPFEEDSGFFILAKFVDEDELHLTAFRCPVRQTLYIPANVIHSNDYLTGTWRTMLSDEADIDHVHLVRVNKQKQMEHFMFTFATRL